MPPFLALAVGSPVARAFARALYLVPLFILRTVVLGLWDFSALAVGSPVARAFARALYLVLRTVVLWLWEQTKNAIAAAEKEVRLEAEGRLARVTARSSEDAAQQRQIAMVEDIGDVAGLRALRRHDCQRNSSESPELHPRQGEEMLGPHPGGPLECPICFDITAEEMSFTVDCKDQHVLCVTCLHRHCSVQLLDNGLIPACPQCPQSGCRHELSQQEVDRVFQMFFASDGDSSENNRRALDTYGTILTRRGLQLAGAIPCVSPECDNWMVPARTWDAERVKCHACDTEFCSSCKRAPYHYTAACDEVVAVGRAWSAWLIKGKATFLKAMAAQDDEHKALLDQHTRRKQQHDLTAKEAERVRLEYDQMECWKESNCRCCPKCGSVIEKISGCTRMTCGRDTEGGNVQRGCGLSFVWDDAPRYKGDRGERKTTPFTEQQPGVAARSRHFIAEGIPLPCDYCHRDVVGPLFRCVHCPSFACCLGCQDMACRDPKHEHHIFRLVD